MRLKIVQVGEPVLRGRARPLTRDEITSDEIKRLITDMRETMYDAPGVGLAAPQVGMPLQLAVIEDREDFLKAIPPAELERKSARPSHSTSSSIQNRTRRRSHRPIFRRLSQPLRLFRSRPALSPGPRHLLGRTRPRKIHPRLRLVRSHPPARNRSPPRHSLHRQNALAHFLFFRKSHSLLEVQTHLRSHHRPQM